MPERDPLERLQNAWANLDTPTMDRDLADEDSSTQESVAYLKQAWAQVEIPNVVLPQPARIWKKVGLWTSIAAALLVSALVFFMNPNATQKSMGQPSMTASAPERLSSPRLIATTKSQVQVLAGRVRLTMLRDPNISPSVPTTDS
ncbi:MAG: hypothetical protein COA70_13950 [Planctomycetota bacterium]|nr:MAG: hypothetical protein COA70_13950 [Planctomycetota bacterium]